jgi:protocatechuate 3,4-dioxygenase beta subunit
LGAEHLNRSDIRTDPSDGSVRPGVLLNLTINLQQASSSNCGPLAGARVDVWHCDAGGTYSGETANNSKVRKYLRGYQIDDNGNEQFTTTYPGWYSRTIHIHVRVRTYSGTTQIGEFVNRIFFDEAVSDTIVKTVAPDNTRPNRDTNDMVVTGANNGSVVYAALTASPPDICAAKATFDSIAFFRSTVADFSRRLQLCTAA